jgi:hypothetical protein
LKTNKNNQQQEIMPTQQSRSGGNKRPDVIAIEQIMSQISSIQSEISSLPDSLPPVWSLPMSIEDNIDTIIQLDEQLSDVAQREEIFQNIVTLVDRHLAPLLEKGTIHPEGKHRHEFAVIVERLLQLYSHCVPLVLETKAEENTTTVISVYEECEHLHRLLKSYGYEQSHVECHCTVLTAAREGRWVEAATLYENHIDPDKTGYLPMVEKDDIHAATVGLYAMARAALAMGTRPVESVMDGVLKLTMVSPSDSETCKLVMDYYCCVQYKL